MSQKSLIERLWEVGPLFVQGAPHAKLLGMTFVSVDIGRATLSLPYNPKFIGNPKTRVLHGGAVTTMLDQASGLAAIAGFDTFRTVATLNLSIDYMRAATPGARIIAKAECFHVTRAVAFIRAVATDDGNDSPMAVATGTFTMVPSKLGEN